MSEFVKYNAAALSLSAILIIGAFFRFYDLPSLPNGLYPDEAVNGRNVLEAIQVPPPSGGFKFFYTDNNGREGLFINLQALAVAAFGTEPWTLRVVSAVFGTLAILGVFLAAREFFYWLNNAKIAADKRRLFNPATAIGLLAAFFLATNFWHINFSRIGFRAIMLPTVSLFAVYWLMRGLRTKSLRAMALAGASLGLGLHTYIAFRFVPFVAAVPLVFSLGSWVRDRKKISVAPNLKLLLIFSVLAFIVALPMGIYFLQYPDQFSSRSSGISIFSAAHPMLEFAKSNIITLGMYNIVGDCNARHNLPCSPELLWPVGIMFLLGLVVSIRDLVNTRGYNRIFPLTLLGWFFIMTIPATMTREGLPHALRAIGTIPPVMIFAGYGMWQIIRLARSYWGETDIDDGKITVRRPRNRPALAVALGALMVFIAAMSYQSYFNVFRESPETAKAFRQDLLDLAHLVKQKDPRATTLILANYPDLHWGLPIETDVIKFVTNTVTPERQKESGVRYLLPDEFKIIAPPEGPAAQLMIIPMNQSDLGVLQEIRARGPQFREDRIGNFNVLVYP